MGKWKELDDNLNQYLRLATFPIAVKLFEEKDSSIFGCMKGTIDIKGDIIHPCEEIWEALGRECQVGTPTKGQNRSKNSEKDE